MKLAIFHMEEIPTLFMLEKAARKAGFSPYLLHLRDMRFFVGETTFPPLTLGRTRNASLPVRHSRPLPSVAYGRDPRDPTYGDCNFDIKVGNISLKDFSLIFVRGFWNYQNEVSLLGKFCDMHRIPLFDSAVRTNPIISKNDDLFLLGRRGFRLIKTIFLENHDGHELLMKHFRFPIVSKEVRGKRGFDVYLLKNKKQLQEFLRANIPAGKTLATKTYQFQEFIPADFDVRVLVLGNKVLGAIERRSADPNDFRHNVSLGGSARQIPVTPEMRRLAIKAAKVLKFEFAGVDFITHKKTGKMYLLEVNRSPGFEGFMKATGIDVSMELMNFFLRFARKNLKSQA